MTTPPRMTDIEAGRPKPGPHDLRVAALPHTADHLRDVAEPIAPQGRLIVARSVDDTAQQAREAGR